MTLREAAAELGVSPITLRLQVYNKKLAAVKLGRDWFVTRAEVDRYRSDHRRK